MGSPIYTVKTLSGKLMSVYCAPEFVVVVTTEPDTHEETRVRLGNVARCWF